jgi:pimeloyl-ACP methyl ester carboxylesterase
MAALEVTGADGVVVSAIDEGEGRAVVIVHPGGSDASSWGPVASLLTDEFRVVRILRRIYASDGPIVLPHAMTTEAADILAVAGQLERPILVGHSSGAVAGLEAALASPQTFCALVLYEPPLSTRSAIGGEAVTRARAALVAGNPVEAMQIHMGDIVRVPGAELAAMFAIPEARAQFARFAAAQIADDEALDALGVGIDRYARLDLPVVLVEGDRSPPHLRQRLADLAATLPNVLAVVTLADQDHIAHMTAPDRLAEVIRDCAERVAR